MEQVTSSGRTVAVGKVVELGLSALDQRQLGRACVLLLLTQTGLELGQRELQRLRLLLAQQRQQIVLLHLQFETCSPRAFINGIMSSIIQDAVVSA